MNLLIEKAIEWFSRLSDLQMSLLVFFMSIFALIPAWINYDVIALDGARLYVPIAKSICQRTFSSFDGSWFPLPLYENLICCLSKFSGLNFETSGRLISSVFYVIAAMGLYRLTLVLSGEKIVGLLSIIFFIANRQLLQCSVDVLKESMLVALIIWGNYFIYVALKSSGDKVSYLISGIICFVAGSMLRSTALIFLFTWIIVWIFSRSTYLTIRIIITTGILLVLGLILYSLDLSYFKGSYSIYQYKAIMVNSYSGIKDVFFAFIEVIRSFLKRSYYLMGLFGILGIYLNWKSEISIYAKHSLIVLILFFIACLLTGWNYSGTGSDRYLLAGIIYIMPIAAVAIKKIISDQKRGLMYWLAIFTIITCPFLWGGKAFARPDADKLLTKEVGVWILSQLGPNQDIISNRPRINFYANANIVTIEENKELGSLDKLVIYRRVDWTIFELKDIVMPKEIKKPIAVDLELEDGILWEKLLSSYGFKPDKRFKSIIVYLPKGQNSYEINR
jgi:hypothetical protein